MSPFQSLSVEILKCGPFYSAKIHKSGPFLIVLRRKFIKWNKNKKLFITIKKSNDDIIHNNLKKTIDQYN